MGIEPQKQLREKFFRDEMFPTLFCQGCGIGQVMNYTAQAMSEANVDASKTILVSGIGCSSRIPAYFNVSGVHTVHGRAIAYATGIKLANPKLKVIVFTGDGDCIGIGGNHFLHAIRRNVDITVIVLNNFTYGMTGGQVSPTTLPDSYTTTTQYGNLENPISISRLATLMNASYVARWTTAHPVQAISAMTKAIGKKGFSVVEMLSQCPTNFGRKNRQKSAFDALNYFRENTIINSKELMEKSFIEYRRMLEENIVIGEFQDIEKPTFMDHWAKLCMKFLEEDEKGV